jgi:YbbR domain-containing protein
VPFARALSNNAHLKVASVVVAVVFWLFAKGEQTSDRLFAIPLVMRGMPEGLTIVRHVPETVDVVFSGANKELIKLDLWGDPYAVLDMSSAMPAGMFRVGLSPANVVIPHGVAIQVVEVRDPKNLDLEIDRVVERKVKVEPVLAGEPAQGFFVMGEALSMPDSVTVFGPARVIAGMTAVKTAPLDISGHRSRLEAARAIVCEGPWQLHAVPKEVRVALEIEGTGAATLSSVLVSCEHEPGFSSVTIDPKTVEIRLSGPEHVVAGLTAASVGVVVDARGLPRGTHHLAPEIVVPEGVEIESVVPTRFTVTLE